MLLIYNIVILFYYKYNVGSNSWSSYKSELNYNVQTNVFSYNSNKLN